MTQAVSIFSHEATLTLLQLFCLQPKFFNYSWTHYSTFFL